MCKDFSCLQNAKKSHVYLGYAKNERENITPRELEALKVLAKIYFNFNDAQINHAIKTANLIKVLS